MPRIDLSYEQAEAVLDALSYYRLSDYGHGEQRPLDAEQEQHRRLVDESMHAIDKEFT